MRDKRSEIKTLIIKLMPDELDAFNAKHRHWQYDKPVCGSTPSHFVRHLLDVYEDHVIKTDPEYISVQQFCVECLRFKAGRFEDVGKLYDRYVSFLSLNSAAKSLISCPIEKFADNISKVAETSGDRGGPYIQTVTSPNGVRDGAILNLHYISPSSDVAEIDFSDLDLAHLSSTSKAVEKSEPLPSRSTTKERV